jgi:hypothetical protein
MVEWPMSGEPRFGELMFGSRMSDFGWKFPARLAMSATREFRIGGAGRLLWKGSDEGSGAG